MVAYNMALKPIISILLGSGEVCLPASFTSLLSFPVIARPIYVLLLKDDLVSSQLEKLCSMFSVESFFSPETLGDQDDLWCFVLPRWGTISPWSSKATQLLSDCGFDSVIHIEMGFAAFKPQHCVVFPDQQSLIFDHMTQVVIDDPELIYDIFSTNDVKSVTYIEKNANSIELASKSYGLGLDNIEINTLCDLYDCWGRSVTDAELIMFAQANSEHCRHKIFNSSWVIDGEQVKFSLFDIIRQTHAKNSYSTVSAYVDNAAILKSRAAGYWYYSEVDHLYFMRQREIGLSVKVETHNHPTLIEPFSGAATGCGGEIRDESATGTGGFPLAGICGFSVSHLHIPQRRRHWENNQCSVLASHMSTAWDIMLSGPVGAASFNNEFGRPNVCGYFRSFEQIIAEVNYGYHKPIMISGGMGCVCESNFYKKDISVGSLIIQLGGPGYLIGMAGGTASSSGAGKNDAKVDFASVQRSNPEMQRRAQEVISYCSSLDRNPILSLHDVGAGGLANAVPEMVYSANKGARCKLRDILLGETGLSPAEIWCNESQERYVLIINPDDLNLFQSVCQRERCSYAVIGEVIDDEVIILEDDLDGTTPVNFPLHDLLNSNSSKKTIVVDSNKKQSVSCAPISCDDYAIQDVIVDVLRHPTVADKSFLITIGDRTVGGLVYRDQMVGPWQVPVSDCAIITSSFVSNSGYAVAMGERSPLAIISPAASARMAIAEALTNIASVGDCVLSSLVISANWMAEFSLAGQDSALREAVESASSFCQYLGIAIPVGKDSLSMSVSSDKGMVVSPVSLIASAFVPLDDVRCSLTPLLATDSDTDLLLVDLGRGKNRLGNSIFAQVTSQVGVEVPDCDDPEDIVRLFSVIKEMNTQGLLLAYHDRSDGGLLATISEMLFASHIGIDLNIDPLCYDSTIMDVDWLDVRPEFLSGPFKDHIFSALFSEELGAVIQVRKSKRQCVWSILRKYGLSSCTHTIGSINLQHTKLRIYRSSKCLFSEDRSFLHRCWSEVSYEVSRHRDNPECARSEFDLIEEEERTRLFVDLSISMPQSINFCTASVERPAVAILRERGSNGQSEMAAAFHHVGFDVFDVTMTDLLSSSSDFSRYRGLAVVGGFSYGDVPFAGRGWAHSILLNDNLRKIFKDFFNRPDTFSLGVCNGCQMLSQIRSLIPGTDLWPAFESNLSRQFEARLVMTKVIESPSIFFRGMEGSCLPTIVSHAEGRASRIDAGLVCLRYINGRGDEDDAYPLNPNGSFRGNTGFTSLDGSVTMLMPHPERLFRDVQTSWTNRSSCSLWSHFFYNARVWCGH
ncbi:putative phosphoribosylformylglycinamidine synthase [Candidatus Ichthyocystis hellenicum]|uniref:Phosphoribosylformylglycinamidine synthase n=3 Tax=Candidatus Ichthyocystis TaxID=2929841 RepID=A0A0S4M4U8_9BURK|nr:putative phosphoribosylformylglycinamidine synthase [Candidatus Ichthyocystis hellenicum]